MRRRRLSQYKQNKLIELFVAGVTAGTAARLFDVKKYLRFIISTGCIYLSLTSSPYLEMFEGKAEADESYFGRHRKSRRARYSREGRRIRTFKAQRQGLYRCRTQYTNGRLTAYYP